MKFASIRREVMVSFGIAKRIDGDDRRPAGIPDDVCQKLSQNPRAASGLGSHKADAIGALSSIQEERRNSTQN